MVTGRGIGVVFTHLVLFEIAEMLLGWKLLSMEMVILGSIEAKAQYIPFKTCTLLNPNYYLFKLNFWDVYVEKKRIQ